MQLKSIFFFRPSPRLVFKFKFIKAFHWNVLTPPCVCLLTVPLCMQLSSLSLCLCQWSPQEVKPVACNSVDVLWVCSTSLLTVTVAKNGETRPHSSPAEITLSRAIIIYHFEFSRGQKPRKQISISHIVCQTLVWQWEIDVCIRISVMCCSDCNLDVFFSLVVLIYLIRGRSARKVWRSVTHSSESNSDGSPNPFWKHTWPKKPRYISPHLWNCAMKWCTPVLPCTCV